MSLAEALATEVGVVPLEAKLIAEKGTWDLLASAQSSLADYLGGKTYGIGERILELFAMPLPDIATWDRK